MSASLRRVRVMVVDDSAVARRLLTQALALDPLLEVVATAASGEIALRKLDQCSPDVVTLDVEMPGLNGLETLRLLRGRYPRLQVIMFSALTERGAAATLDALALGASDYATKPSNARDITASLASICRELGGKIKALAPWLKATPASPATLVPPATARSSAGPSASGSISAGSNVSPPKVELVVIGVSTGGPNALAAIFSELPATLGVPLLVVQHMPPVFTRYLAQRLDQCSPLQVRESVAGQPLVAGSAYLAPGNYHLSVSRQAGSFVALLDQQPPENSCRPAVDVLFRSAAEITGPRTLGVILTGMGHDGLRGSRELRQAGARVIAQDEATSVVWGMPGAVVQAGLATEILPLDQIAAAIRCATNVPMLSGTRVSQSV